MSPTPATVPAAEPPVRLAGRAFKAVAGRGPVLVADSSDPMPAGVDVDLAGSSTQEESLR